MMQALTKFKRLDKRLTDDGMVANPQRARELIQVGAVTVNGAVITAVQCPVHQGHDIAISGIDSPWVSPDAVRLFDTLEALKLDVRGRNAVDIGTGVGGFTEVLLQKGVKKVYAIEKEHFLLHESLNLSPRIKNLQRMDAKDINKTHIDGEFDLVVADIGSENFIEVVSPLLRLAEGALDFIAFIDDKKIAKELERTLRMEHGLMIKRVPDSLQKESAVFWLQKRI